MKHFILIVILPILGLAANPSERYRHCLSSSNKLESPADRDAEKIDCYKRGRSRNSIPICLNLARVLEHTTASDSLILDCLSDNILKVKFEECISTAKKLVYSDNRDKALFMCLENHPVRASRCKSFSQEMTFPHNKMVALNICLTKN